MKQEVHFKNIQSTISELLDTAEFDVKIAVAWFTDKHLISKLKKLAKAGVEVTIIIYDDKINNKDLFEELYNLNCKVYLSRKLMHNKFCIIDNNIVINGSYNWTYSAHSNNENITVTYSNKTFTEDFVKEFNKLHIKCNTIDSHFADYFKSAKIVEQLIEDRMEEIKVKKSYYYGVYPFFYKVERGVFFVDNDDFFKRLISLNELKKMIDFESLNKKFKAQISIRNEGLHNYYKDIFYHNIADIEFDNDNMAPFSEESHLAINQYGSDFKVFIIDRDNKKSSAERIFNLRINEFFVHVRFFQKYKEPKEEWHLFYSKELESLFEINKNDYKILDSIIILNEKKYNGVKFFNIIDFNGKRINDIDYIDCKILENSIELKLLPSHRFNIEKGYDWSVFNEKDYRIDIFDFNGKLLSSKCFYDDTNRYQNLIVNIYRDDLKRFEDKYCHLNKQEINVQLYFLELLIIYDYMGNGFRNFSTVFNKNPISLLKCVEYEIKNDNKLYSNAKSKHIVIKTESEPFCYIATLAYEDINHPKVQNFRDYRDDYLTKTALGNLFIKYYYKYSPSVVRALEPYKRINKLIRLGLDILNYFIPKSKL